MKNMRIGFCLSVLLALGCRLCAQDPNGPAQPSLTILRDGPANAVLTWPRNDAGFVLQTASSLANASSWMPVTNPPAIAQGEHRLSVPATNSQGYFRLHRVVADRPVIASVTGEVDHGGVLTITGDGFGPRKQAAPIIWDIGSAQYVNGTNADACAGFSDGRLINQSVWSASENVAYSLSRPHRHPRLTAHYAGWGQNGNPGKMWLCPPDAPPTQKRFYLSFYRKVKNGGYRDGQAASGGGDGSTKIVRIAGSDYSGTGENVLSAMLYGMRNSHDLASAWIDAGNETTWVRWEIYVDTVKQWFDVWKDGHYHLGSYSGAGGTIEFRPAADWRFRAGLSHYQFDAPWLPADVGIEPMLFGYDDGHQLSAGQEVDLSEIYYDDTQARVEISDQATWNDAPGSQVHREAQGRLLDWSATRIRLVLFQGGFESLSGKYLYVIDAEGRASVNGWPLNNVSHKPKPED